MIICVCSSIWSFRSQLFGCLPPWSRFGSSSRHLDLLVRRLLNLVRRLFPLVRWLSRLVRSLTLRPRLTRSIKRRRSLDDGRNMFGSFPLRRGKGLALRETVEDGAATAPPPPRID